MIANLVSDHFPISSSVGSSIPISHCQWSSIRASRRQLRLRLTGQIIPASDDLSAGLFFELTAGVAGDGTALAGGGLVLNESLCVSIPGDFGRGGFTEHREDQLEIGHVIAQVFTFQSLELLVFGGCEA